MEGLDVLVYSVLYGYKFFVFRNAFSFVVIGTLCDYCLSFYLVIELYFDFVYTNSVMCYDLLFFWCNRYYNIKP